MDRHGMVSDNISLGYRLQMVGRWQPTGNIVVAKHHTIQGCNSAYSHVFHRQSISTQLSERGLSSMLRMLGLDRIWGESNETR